MNDSLYYKNLTHTSTEQEREKFIRLAIEYKQKNQYINPETGQIFDNYPSVLRDFRKYRANIKMGNDNSYPRRLFSMLGDNAYFYTFILGDIFPSWAKYENIFNLKKVLKIKRRLNKMIKGPYIANLEVCAFTGSHVHIISGLQTYKYLKAETKVYDEFKLVKYVSKSCVSIKDEGTEEYLVMVGQYLSERNKLQKDNNKVKRLPRRGWTRLKS